jgi:curved DNA-binding protein
MEYKDYYKILGVKKDATKEDIKRAYRKLARQHHPDINPNNKQATAQFADINEAHEVLSDDDKRRKYDVLGADWQKYQNAGPQGAGPQTGFDWSKYSDGGNGGSYETFDGDLNDLFGEGGFSDFFQNIFGSRRGGAGGKSRSFSTRGQDYQAEIFLDLEEAYGKTVKTIGVNGQNLRITLEPGITDGQTIKLKGKGGPGRNGGKSGDLFITLKIKPHPAYKREGNDLFMDVPVDVYTAMLGGEQTVKLLSGSVKLKIPPGTKGGTVFRIKGKGFPEYGKNGTCVDLFLKVELEIPKELSGEERQLVEKLAQMRRR